MIVIVENSRPGVVVMCDGKRRNEIEVALAARSTAWRPWRNVIRVYPGRREVVAEIKISAAAAPRNCIVRRLLRYVYERNRRQKAVNIRPVYHESDNKSKRSVCEADDSDGGVCDRRPALMPAKKCRQTDEGNGM